MKKVLLYIWQLPQNIIALLMLPFLGKLELISYKKFCFAFKGKNMMGGISLGNFAFLSPSSAKKVATVMHEQEGHTFDSKVFGPLYLFVISKKFFIVLLHLPVHFLSSYILKMIK